MGKIYTKLILWLLRPVLPLPRQAIEFIDAANASPGDILVLRTAKPMRPEQRIYVRPLFDEMEKNAGIKIMILEPGVDIVQLIKFHDKGGDNPGNADHDGDQPLPFDGAEIDHGMRKLG